MSYLRMLGEDGELYEVFGRKITGREKDAYNDGFAKGNGEGFAEGRKEAEAKCEAKHFVAMVQGSGGTSLTFPCRFEPDCIVIMGFGNLTNTSDNTLISLTLDLGATGAYGGCSFPASGGKLARDGAAGYGASGIGGYWERNETTGEITIKNVVNGKSTQTNKIYNIFDSNLTYTVIAVKHA